ncbi:hypothetical protein LXL04_011326 [Taraxacum kok-saghyz]
MKHIKYNDGTSDDYYRRSSEVKIGGGYRLWSVVRDRNVPVSSALEGIVSTVFMWKFKESSYLLEMEANSQEETPISTGSNTDFNRKQHRFQRMQIDFNRQHRFQRMQHRFPIQSNTDFNFTVDKITPDRHRFIERWRRKELNSKKRSALDTYIDFQFRKVDGDGFDRCRWGDGSNGVVQSMLCETAPFRRAPSAKCPHFAEMPLRNAPISQSILCHFYVRVSGSISQKDKQFRRDASAKCPLRLRNGTQENICHFAEHPLRNRSFTVVNESYSRLLDRPSHESRSFTVVNESYSRLLDRPPHESRENILPVNGSILWHETNYTKPLPPIARRVPGRPTIKRKRHVSEHQDRFTRISSKGKKIQCRNCFQFNHNIRSCKNPKVTPPPKPKKKMGRPRLNVELTSQTFTPKCSLSIPPPLL